MNKLLNQTSCDKVVCVHSINKKTRVVEFIGKQECHNIHVLNKRMHTSDHRCKFSDEVFPGSKPSKVKQLKVYMIPT